MKGHSPHGVKSSPTIVIKKKEEHTLNGSIEILNMLNVLQLEHEIDSIAKAIKTVFDINVHLSAKRFRLI